MVAAAQAGGGGVLFISEMNDAGPGILVQWYFALFAVVEKKPSLSQVRKIREQVLRPMVESERVAPKTDMKRVKAILGKRS